MKKLHSIAKSFEYAFNGLKVSVKQEPNLRIHLIIAAFAVSLAYVLDFRPLEWAVLVITISMVFILELVNTTLETLVDLVSPEIKDKAKIAKDVSAATVLLGALTAILIGLLLFLPKILPLSS